VIPKFHGEMNFCNELASDQAEKAREIQETTALNDSYIQEAELFD
jgi:hypothetical protein